GRSCHLVQLTRQTKNGSCLCNKRIRVKGLRHIHVGSDFLPSLSIEFLTFCSQQNHMDILQAQLILHRITDIKAVLFRHHDVEKNEVRFFLADGCKRLFTIGSSDEVHTLIFQLLEGLLNQHSQVRLVVNDQNLHRGLIDKSGTEHSPFPSRNARRAQLRHWTKVN